MMSGMFNVGWVMRGRRGEGTGKGSKKCQLEFADFVGPEKKTHPVVLVSDHAGLVINKLSITDMMGSVTRARLTTLTWQVEGLSPGEHPHTSPSRPGERGRPQDVCKGSTRRSDPFQVGPLSCRVRIETFARGGNEVSIYLDVSSAGERSTPGGELWFSLSVKNQKDEQLSISMDASEQILPGVSPGGDAHVSRGFDHFMTSHLLLDEQAGYLEAGVVLIQAEPLSLNPPCSDSAILPFRNSCSVKHRTILTLD